MKDGSTNEVIERLRRRFAPSFGERLRRRLGGIRRVMARRSPHLSQPFFPARQEGSTNVLLIPVVSSFDQRQPGSGVLIREGIARGWSESCGPVKLLTASEITAELERWQRPAVLLSPSELAALSERQARRLRKADLFVWVDPHPKRFESFREEFPLFAENDVGLLAAAYRNLVAAEPKFVWAPVGEAGMELYQGWTDDGFRFERILLAADPERYHPEPEPALFGDVRLTYVGGYWPEKAQAYEEYLRPWEDELAVYGNSAWPYRHYRGQLDPAREHQLYSTAGLVPLVTTPAGRRMAELTERYFKVPACRAFAIADANPAVREAFSEDELLQAESPEHFHELVRDFLAGTIDTEGWRERAYRAVRERHLYRHRALQIRRLLGREEARS